MATEQTGLNISYQANADLSAKQYFLVKRHTVADQCALVAGTTDIPIGILQNKPAASGRAAEIMTVGRSKAAADGTSAIAIGDKLGPDANGRLVKKTTDHDVVCAMAEEALASGTSIITVTLFPPYTLSA